MPRIKILLGLAILGLALVAGWQIGAAELANVNFQEDLRDMASQAGAHVGVVAPSSDEQVTRTVMRKASEHGIELTPEQITVRRATSGELSTWYLAAEYTVPVNLGIYSFPLHFNPSSDRKGL
jgi:hypothetical protein